MKAATIRDVAARAQVSVASVSRVLTGAGAVTEPTRQRVLEAVAALAYVPHSGARSLSTSRTDTVGVVLPDLFGEFFSELIRGMDLAARTHGLHLIVSSSHDDADEASAAIRSMRGRVDGMIVLSPHLDAANLAASLAGSLPVLLMNGGATDAGRPSIVVDNHGGAVAAVEHLIAGGARDIAHICGPTGNLEAEARMAGYVQAMAAAGLKARVVDGDFSQSSGHAAVRAMLAEGSHSDAIFAGNDVMAVGALLALQEAGVRCPEDVAVVGFDDVPIAQLVRPSLSTMRINIAETGRRALDRLVDLIRAKDDEALPADVACEIVRPVLVARDSSRANPSINTQASDDGRTAVKSTISSGGHQDV
ncbi:LacI family DNA-binding transcriptional regulator [Brevundimonas variabilis]|uniref:LacI family transcriptional regulator n=1 Tax=Brevundimonas variabilis TaxID=74312 RepID=A0A7W9CIF8_9CAUL|nr:LacI family DNA-binding transcriptional regulator [Brevundimonas variabilis]MBB5746270.1 LacI family transcriptional regulator [Brevundimonas variabilis]